MSLRTYETTLRIDTEECYIEAPAVYDVCEDYAGLVSFWIGSREFTVDDAIAMIGLHNVQEQEVRTRDKWLEEIRSSYELEAD